MTHTLSTKSEKDFAMRVNSTKSKQSREFNSDFWKYWTGQTISNLSSSITLFALPLLVYKLTGSALNLGITTAAEFLPYLLFGLILGAWTDRVDRKRMTIGTDIARALIIASIPLLYAFGLLTVWWIYVVGFVHATLTICFEAGQFAAIPSLVNQDDLVTANGRIQASYSGASIVGPLLAGVLVTLVPLAALMLIDAFSFLVSSFSLALIRISFNTGEQRKRCGRRTALCVTSPRTAQYLADDGNGKLCCCDNQRATHLFC